MSEQHAKVLVDKSCQPSKQLQAQTVVENFDEAVLQLN